MLWPHLLALTIALSASSAAADAALSASITAGDVAFVARGEPGRIEAALAAYRQASALRPGDPAAELRLARALQFAALSDPSSSRTAWAEAARAAERALRTLAPAWAAEIDRGADPAAVAPRVPPAGAEALYWFALAVYSGARTHGFAAVLAIRSASLASMERAAALDEQVDFAGPHRALGSWLSALPVGVGGGAASARTHFERARALFPAFGLNAVREAETYAVLVQDRKLFESSLATALAVDETAHPEMAPENRLAKQLARALLDGKDRLF
jgi:tetratricopeptide (TPR) repeat protein